MGKPNTPTDKTMNGSEDDRSAGRGRASRGGRRPPPDEHSGDAGTDINAQAASPQSRRDKDANTPSANLLGQRPMAQDVDRQVAAIKVRGAVPNGHTALAIPVPKIARQVCPGMAEIRLSADLCNSARL